MSEYKFELTDRNVESTRATNKSKFCIEVTSPKFTSTNLYIEFQLRFGNNHFRTEKIDIKTNAAWSEAEHIAYLKGYFGFSEKDELKVAVINLANRIDNQHYLSNFGSSWKDFVDEFMEWYEITIKPLLEDEVRIFNKYAKNTNNQR